MSALENGFAVVTIDFYIVFCKNYPNWDQNLFYVTHGIVLDFNSDPKIHIN